MQYQILTSLNITIHTVVVLLPYNANANVKLQTFYSFIVERVMNDSFVALLSTKSNRISIEQWAFRMDVVFGVKSPCVCWMHVCALCVCVCKFVVRRIQLKSIHSLHVTWIYIYIISFKIEYQNQNPLQHVIRTLNLGTRTYLITKQSGILYAYSLCMSSEHWALHKWNYVVYNRFS